MRYYDISVVRARIEFILSDEWKPHPNIPGETRAEALLSMFNAMTHTVWEHGYMEARTAIKDALDALKKALGEL